MSRQISFDRSLYLPEAVDAAAAAYAEYATIQVTPADNATQVVIDSSETDPDAVAHAFCNHVLYETIAQMRRAAL